MKNQSKLRHTYRIASVSISVLAVAYLLLLTFPQPLFGHSVEYGKFSVRSREPIGPEIETVLNEAETRLRRSPLYDESVPRHIYLTNG